MKNGNNSNSNNNNSNDIEEKKIFCSVSEAKQMESGHITVKGMIASYSTLYKAIAKSEWECRNPSCKVYGGETYAPPVLLPLSHLDNTCGFSIKCFKCGSTNFTVTHTYDNARSIQLEDVDKTSDKEGNNNIDRLEVVVYGRASSNLVAGEVVDTVGHIYIQRKSDNGKGKKLVSVLHCNEIKYRNKGKIIVTTKDIEIFHKHKRICDIAYKRELEGAGRNEPWSKKIIPMQYKDRIVAMLAPNVIGHSDAKLGLLRSLVGGRTDNGDDNGRRGRINTLLVGDPGTAKSILARESTKQIPNSRYVTAQNASGKSLVGIVDKETDSLFLRLGVAVLSKGAVCAINEMGFMSPEDQGHLTDIAEEGRCTLDKFGTHFELDAPTTIIATANPYYTNWTNGHSISKDEIPLLKTFLDRCDQVYGFRDAPSEQEVENYADHKTRIRKRRPHNYNFLSKLLMYARTITPKMTKDAEVRINKFWTKAKIGDAATNRTYDSIFRLAEAQAKLNLAMEVDDDIATQTMDSVSLMLSQYGKIVSTVQSPRDITYNAFLNILKQTKADLSVTELCRIACEENKQVSEYLGNKFKIQDNIKLRTLVSMLLNHSSIKQIQQKPMILRWLNEEGDVDSCAPGTHSGSNNTDDSVSKDNLSDAHDVYDTRSNFLQNNSRGLAHTTSYASHISYKERVEDFFRDASDLPYQSLPQHTLEQSPCYSIIDREGEFYYCKLHPKERNIYLQSIEHHCKYKEAAYP